MRGSVEASVHKKSCKVSQKRHRQEGSEGEGHPWACRRDLSRKRGRPDWKEGFIKALRRGGDP